MVRKRGRPKANGLALHHRLYMMLQQQLADGTIPPGAALPSEPDLALKTRLSRTTVRRALARLASEGLIERRHGSGTYATMQGARRAKAAAAFDCAALIGDLRQMARVTTARVQQFAMIATPPRILEACPELGPRVLFVQATRHYRGKPFVVINHYIQERQAKRFSKSVLRKSPAIFVFEKAGMVPTLGNQQVTAIAADHVFSRELAVNIGAPLLAIRRSVRDAHGMLLEYHEAFYDPEVYSLHMEVHRERVGKSGMRWRPVG
ncbi:MAG: Mannosyl-D-glycerate transport/metabolism system repressor MngR [Steroidobacteraceae bacterium]|nr:Mannosyl-D-glycerate transport/metabolism system repressor MngR [Steroidobacteraceae bacterium]